VSDSSNEILLKNVERFLQERKRQKLLTSQDLEELNGGAKETRQKYLSLRSSFPSLAPRWSLSDNYFVASLLVVV